MLANAPNGKVAAALADIYSKEGMSCANGGGEEGGKQEYTPVVYVAKVRWLLLVVCCFALFVAIMVLPLFLLLPLLSLSFCFCGLLSLLLEVAGLYRLVLGVDTAPR